MAELSKLLGFMSAWDRREALMKYEAMFDEASDEAELIASLGSPTKLAIGLALNYVPSPAPASMPMDTVEPGESVGEFAAGAEVEPETVAVEETLAVQLPEQTAVAAPVEAAETGESVPVRPRRKVRAFGLIVSILFGLIFGVPIALLLICIGIPFIVLGLSVAALTVWAVLSTIAMLAMVSDILVVVGVGLVVCALGLLLTWFGLWLSFELGYLWIGGVVLRLGRALTYKKEVAAK